MSFEKRPRQYAQEINDKVYGLVKSELNSIPKKYRKLVLEHVASGLIKIGTIDIAMLD